jgi:hypothetical protein
VDQVLLKETGASGIVIKGNGIQVIYGPSVTIVKSNFEEFVEKVRAGEVPESRFIDATAIPVAAAPAAPAKPKNRESASMFPARSITARSITMTSSTRRSRPATTAGSRRSML